MTDTVNVSQEMIDAVMKVAVGVDEYGSEVFPGPSVAAELVRVVIEDLKQDPWVIEQARRQAAQTGMIDTDNVPLNCRQRLAAEGKAYPKSSCSFCGSMSPNWQACDALLAAAPASDELLGALEKLRSEEGDSVTILCDDPEAPSPDKRMAIEVDGDWTNWQPRRFYGADILSCLRLAVAAKHKGPQS